MIDMCRIEDGLIIYPCSLLKNSVESINPKNKPKGVHEWRDYIGNEICRNFYGVKSGKYLSKGIVFNFCPFCGEDISFTFSGDIDQN